MYRETQVQGHQSPRPSRGGVRVPGDQLRPAHSILSGTRFTFCVALEVVSVSCRWREPTANYWDLNSAGGPWWAGGLHSRGHGTFPQGHSSKPHPPHSSGRRDPTPIPVFTETQKCRGQQTDSPGSGACHHPCLPPYPSTAFRKANITEGKKVTPISTKNHFFSG